MPNEKMQKISKAKGRPWIHWVGKSALEHVEYCPAQTLEQYHATDQQPSADEWQNLLLWGDNKEICGHLMRKYRGKVDLIYIDPPFDSKADYIREVQLRGGKKGPKIDGEEQSLGEQVQYSDMWANDEYLQFMYHRLQLLRELLSETGSIYLHCDWHQNHRLRMVMDEVFGEENFRNEIIWKYTGGLAPSMDFNRKHDNILRYSKNNFVKFNPQFEEYSDAALKRFNLKDKNGRYKATFKDGAEYKTYMQQGKKMEDVWDIPIVNKTYEQSCDYPTQKPEALLERIIKASSNPGDLVLDIFCGSGTTPAVAQKLGRRWIAADINRGALQTTKKRLSTIMQEQAAQQGKKSGKLLEDSEDAAPAALSYTVQKINNYDLQLQHNEALQLALKKIGVEKIPGERFFNGKVGDTLVFVIPLNRATPACTRADIDAIEIHLEQNAEETRDVMVVALGAEPDVASHIAEKNHLRKNVGNKYSIKDLSETGFFTHKSAQASIRVTREGDETTVQIEDYHSPTIAERLKIDTKNGILQAEIGDYRAQIDNISIDWSYNGNIFTPTTHDSPRKKQDMIQGKYAAPTKQCGSTIAVRIVDMLGEEVFLTRPLGQQAA